MSVFTVQSREGEGKMSTKLELDFPMLKTLQRKLEEVDGALDSAVTTALED